MRAKADEVIIGTFMFICHVSIRIRSIMSEEPTTEETLQQANDGTGRTDTKQVNTIR